MDKTKKIIAVLGGTGDLGRGLVLRWARAGYTVIVGSRREESAVQTALEANQLLKLNTIRGMENVAAANAAEIVALTVPYANHAAIIDSVRAAVQGKIVIDVTVPLRPPKVRTVQMPPLGSAAKEAQHALGDNVRVVSAFQNIAATHLQDLSYEIDCDVLICGNDRESCEQVKELAEDAGMVAWHAGPIENSAISEALTSGLIFINGKYKIDGAGIRITYKTKPG
jgi:8-hydroxy-5-deazaflavin:NADPH oxidoreductase